MLNFEFNMLTATRLDVIPGPVQVMQTCSKTFFVVLDRYLTEHSLFLQETKKISVRINE